MKRKPVSAGDTHYQAERHFQKSSAGQLLVPKTGSGPVGGGEVTGRVHSGPCVLDPDHEGPCMTQEDVDNDCPACGNTHGTHIVQTAVTPRNMVTSHAHRSAIPAM